MNCVFTAKQIRHLYDRNYKAAVKMLKTIPVCCSNEPKFKGLTGWIFEQTIQYCIQKEFRAAKIKQPLLEQACLGGRARADLQVGDALIEIKFSGVYSKESYAKYQSYRKVAEKEGFNYLFFSGRETYKPNRSLAKKVFGNKNVFYLDSDQDWERFVWRLIGLTAKTGAHSRT